MVAVLVMSERLEKRPEVTLEAFPPPIIAGTTFVSWFHVSMPPPRGNALGSIYIGLFRSRQLIWSENGRQRSFEGQT
jgi:hypothetical protein